MSAALMDGCWKVKADRWFRFLSFQAQVFEMFVLMLPALLSCFAASGYTVKRGLDYTRDSVEVVDKGPLLCSTYKSHNI